MKKKETGPSLFFMNFQGEFLTILLDTKLNTATQNEDEASSMEIPMTLQAFLIDEDERYYYLGSEPLQIDRAVPKTKVLYVEIIRPQDALIDILDNMEMPSKGSAN